MKPGLAISILSINSPSVFNLLLISSAITNGAFLAILAYLIPAFDEKSPFDFTFGVSKTISILSS